MNAELLYELEVNHLWHPWNPSQNPGEQSIIMVSGQGARVHDEAPSVVSVKVREH